MHYVIGDVHGHFDTLKALVAKLPTEATLVFVGDLVDRGRQSSESLGIRPYKMGSKYESILSMSIRGVTLKMKRFLVWENLARTVSKRAK
ncbi:MAG: metallophosphoesterase [Sulfurospirillum cavolei]|nr:metallophosphoesterase [Sulfurospirillum cavolei]